MNRKSFLTTALLSFAALLMPRKAQALTEEPAPKIAPPPPPLSSAAYGNNRDAVLVCTTTEVGRYIDKSFHFDWFWVGPADGVVHCDSSFLTGPTATLPLCISPCPSPLVGHCGFTLTQEVLAHASPDERLVVFPDGDDGATPVYYLGSWIHTADEPPRWAAP